MRLVMTGRGSFLYIKGGNQWHSLSLVSTESISTDARRKRGDLERNIKKVVDFDGHGEFAATASTGSQDYLDKEGAIMNPGGKGRQSALPDVPL